MTALALVLRASTTIPGRFLQKPALNHSSRRRCPQFPARLFLQSDMNELGLTISSTIDMLRANRQPVMLSGQSVRQHDKARCRYRGGVGNNRTSLYTRQDLSQHPRAKPRQCHPPHPHYIHDVRFISSSAIPDDPEGSLSYCHDSRIS